MRPCSTASSGSGGCQCTALERARSGRGRPPDAIEWATANGWPRRHDPATRTARAPGATRQRACARADACSAGPPTVTPAVRRLGIAGKAPRPPMPRDGVHGSCHRLHPARNRRSVGDQERQPAQDSGVSNAPTSWPITRTASCLDAQPGKSLIGDAARIRDPRKRVPAPSTGSRAEFPSDRLDLLHLPGVGRRRVAVLTATRTSEREELAPRLTLHSIPARNGLQGFPFSSLRTRGGPSPLRRCTLAGCSWCSYGLRPAAQPRRLQPGAAASAHRFAAGADRADEALTGTCFGGARGETKSSVLVGRFSGISARSVRKERDGISRFEGSQTKRCDRHRQGR